MATEEQRQALISSLKSLAAGIAVIFALLFIPGGAWDWPLGWTFMIVLTFMMIGAIAVLWRANPDIFVARRRIHAGTQGWDYIFLVLIIGGFLAIPILAGLDHRHDWAQGPLWAVVIGYILFVLGFAGQIWSQAVNRHFEPGIRIQSDRDHKVVDTGPYAHVRHPGYVSGALLAIGLALVLDSLLSLIPAAIVTVALLFRTVFEDRMLQQELPGYADYALRVRHKWIPGIW